MPIIPNNSQISRSETNACAKKNSLRVPIVIIKTILRNVLPTEIYICASKIWHRLRRRCRDHLKAARIAFQFAVTPPGLPDTLIYFGNTPGDDLLCTAVLRELRRRDRKVCMISNFSELFDGTNDASHIVPNDGDYELFARDWRRDYRALEYAHYDGDDRSEVPQRHIIAELCARAGITGTVTVRPHLILTDAEKSSAAWAKGRIVIQSSGLAARYPMLNKQWYPERFQVVVDALRPNFDFVQLGSASDPKLENVQDLRGATSIRESAAILHNACLYVGNVGFMMHLARAVDCRGVIIFGGREAPWQSGYICNINLHTPLPCSPCWRWNRCELDRQCMKDITADDVIRAVKDLAQNPSILLGAEMIDLKRQ